MLKTEDADKTSLDQKLPVLMINKTKEQENVQKSYFDQDELDNDRAGNHRDSNGKETKPPALKELLEVQANYHACTQTALTIGLPKSMSTFYAKGAWLQIAATDGAAQRYIETTLRQRILHVCNHAV